MEVKETKVTESPGDESALAKNEKRIGGDIISIICPPAIPCSIAFAVSGVLIGLTVAHHVTIETGWQELQLPHNATSSSLLAQARTLRDDGGSGAYYIQPNPSSLTTIASWTGKVIPYLSSSVMALVAFFPASHVLQASRSGRDEALLTPHQLAFLLGLLSLSSCLILPDTDVNVGEGSRHPFRRCSWPLPL